MIIPGGINISTATAQQIIDAYIQLGEPREDAETMAALLTGNGDDTDMVLPLV